MVPKSNPWGRYAARIANVLVVRRPWLVWAFGLSTLSTLLIMGASARDGEPLQAAFAQAPQQQAAESGTASSSYVEPGSVSWTDHGSIFTAGSAGEWDQILWGGFAQGAVRKNGRFHLYYQGSRYYDETYGTVAFRSIGVAVSDDGIKFSKYSGGPVLTWLPNNWLEEGAVSAGVSLTPSGQVAAFYGANTKVDDWQVNADSRLALSDDGLVFRDAGVVLDHRNATIWGSGDELFAIVSFVHDGQWYIYYLPNGNAQARKLGVAWGTVSAANDALPVAGALRSAPSPRRVWPGRRGQRAWGDVSMASAGVTDQNGAPITAWGPGSFAALGGGNYALFFNNGGALTAWRMNVAAPARLTGPVAVYAFDNMSLGTVLLDGNTWYLYYRNTAHDAYGVRTAPAN